jgi:hypothetical protein
MAFAVLFLLWLAVVALLESFSRPLALLAFLFPFVCLLTVLAEGRH